MKIFELPDPSQSEIHSMNWTSTRDNREAASWMTSCFSNSFCRHKMNQTQETQVDTPIKHLNMDCRKMVINMDLNSLFYLNGTNLDRYCKKIPVIIFLKLFSPHWLTVHFGVGSFKFCGLWFIANNVLLIQLLRNYNYKSPYARLGWPHWFQENV